MKNIKTYTLVCQLILAVLFSVFSSCTSVHNFTIEIRQPAKITFPTDVSRIAIVNNAAFPETGDFGAEFYLNNKQVSNPFSIAFDSAIWTSIHALAYQIEAENFFSKVIICNVPVRKDNAVLEIRPIPKQETQMIYGALGADAIISVDRGLFKYSQEMTQLPIGYSSDPYYTFVNTKTLADFAFSVHLKGKENPLVTFSLQDSLYFNPEFVDNDSTLLFQLLPNTMISEAAENIGGKATPYFVPSWKMVDRSLYTSHESRMKEALAYAKADKWISAEKIWLALYDSKNVPKSKAYLAHNLAVVSEMRDNLDTALEWAQQAEAFFRQDNEPKNEKEISRVLSYISSLKERKIEDSLLNEQLRIE